MNVIGEGKGEDIVGKGERNRIVESGGGKKKYMKIDKRGEREEIGRYERVR